MTLEKGVATFDEKVVDWYKFKPTKVAFIFDKEWSVYACGDDIDELGFSKKTNKVLYHNSIRYNDDLVDLDFEQLLSLKGMEQDVLQEIVNIVNIKGSEQLRSLQNIVYSPSKFGLKKTERKEVRL